MEVCRVTRKRTRERDAQQTESDSRDSKRKCIAKQFNIFSPILVKFISYGGVLRQKDVQNLSLSCTSLFDGVSKVLYEALGGVAQCYHQSSLRIALTRNWFTCAPNIDLHCAIRRASKYGHVEVVALLLADARVDPSAHDNYAIRWASVHGHTKVVALLLANARVDPSAEDNYAIRWASVYGHAEVVTLLLADTRVDPSAKDNYAICCASRHGHTEVVQLLLADAHVDPSANNNEAIQQALRKGHADVVKLLLADTRVDLFIKVN